MEQSENDIRYPSIVFKVKDGFFAIDSKNVVSIMQMPAVETLPDAPESVKGVFTFRNQVIPMVSVRTLFGMPTLEVEHAAFCDMLEHRKQDHIRWVTELNRCVAQNEAFTLATNPHQCAFGKWYDTFETDNNAVRFLLNKVEEPHRLLHETALEVFSCSRDCAHCVREECLRDKLQRLEKVYMPTILGLLDEAKELFKNIYRNMLIVIEMDGITFAAIVDDVLAVEDLLSVSGEEAAEKPQTGAYIIDIKKSAKFSNLILVVDEQKMVQAL